MFYPVIPNYNITPRVIPDKHDEHGRHELSCCWINHRLNRTGLSFHQQKAHLKPSDYIFGTLLIINIYKEIIVTKLLEIFWYILKFYDYSKISSISLPSDVH